MTIRLLTAGESHGPSLIAVIEGLPAGMPLNSEMIDQDLARRQQGYGAGPRMKLESDHAQILSGVMEGMTTGAPIALLIENLDHARWKGRAVASFSIPRPGHSDLNGAIKYGYSDLRPSLERSSARETAARVAAGSVCRQFLKQFQIQVGGYVSAIGTVQAELDKIPLSERISRAMGNEVHCPDGSAAEAMQQAIRQAMKDRDTLGGILEGIVLGLPPGLGSFMQWDRRLEAQLGAAILSIPAIKGVEFGTAFENSRSYGTKANDAILLEKGQLVRPTLLSGGLEGGVTTGQPLLVRAAMKPIPTTLTPQPSVDLSTGQPVQTKYERSDFCPVPRAVVIVESMLAFVLANAMQEKLGGDSISEMLPRFQTLRHASLEDFHLESSDHTFWSE